MGKKWISPFLLLLVLSSVYLDLAGGDVGTAASYSPPYIPTRCYGDDRSQLPADATLAAAGAGIWDNGAACGRRYAVHCLSSATAGACIARATVYVTIVDEASTLGGRPSSARTTMALSQIAFSQIASLNASEINIEFAQV